MLSIECVTVDCADPELLAAFWAALLRWEVHSDEEGDIWISSPEPGPADILFLASSDRRTVKNRLHLDLRPDDRDAEVERALSLGATRMDIGQTGDETWEVLADPEGNVFCILRARPAAS